MNIRKTNNVPLFCCLFAVLLFSFVNAVGCSRMPEKGTTYFVDSQSGNDYNNGFSEKTAWKSLEKLQNLQLNPGDEIRFKRGSKFMGEFTVRSSGTSANPILISDYGNEASPAPSFSNFEFNQAKGIYGNCIRIYGQYIIVENLYFHHTVAELPGTTGSFETMWQLGAVYLDYKSSHCIVRNNEFYDCGVGIKSNGSHIVIAHNYLHDCNRVLKEWSWGPLAIWLGGDYQEVKYNKIINYSAVDSRITWGPNSYGGGADGGAIEVDDARTDKAHISIHHNFSKDCQGFLEVTWTDVKQNPAYRNFSIHHNISDDYQQFVALWRGASFKIDNNTIIRRKKNANDWGVFNITQDKAKNKIRNNIIITEKDIPVFNFGKEGRANPQNIIENNLYYAASDSLVTGMAKPGKKYQIVKPKFKNYPGTVAEDYKLTLNSPAIDNGILLNYKIDFENNPIPSGNAPDLGAYEFQE